MQWHSLGCGDNPVKVDFTPEGEIIGVQNLYYSQPRGDTIVHWLYGGVYERPDQMKAIEPRLLDMMQTYLIELKPDDIKGTAGMYRVRQELLRRVNDVVPGSTKDILFKTIILQ